MFPFIDESYTSLPILDAYAVTPADGTDLLVGGVAKACRAFMVGLSGTVTIDTANGSTVTFTAVQAGILHYIVCKRIRLTGTTATGIVACY